MNDIQTILLEYHGKMQGVFDQETMDHHAQVMWHWSKISYSKVFGVAQDNYVKKVEKAKKFQRDLAEGNARLDGMDTEKLLLTGLLEAAQITVKMDSKNKGHKVTTKKHMIASSSTLGILASKHPDVAKAYNIEVQKQTLNSQRSMSRKPNENRNSSRASSYHSAKSTARSRTSSVNRSSSRKPARSASAGRSSRGSSRGSARSTSRPSRSTFETFRTRKKERARQRQR